MANAKSGKFQENVHKRGTGIVLGKEKKDKLPVGPVVLGFFIFVVIGSGRTAISGKVKFTQHLICMRHSGIHGSMVQHPV